MRRGYAAGLRRHGCQTGPARKQTPMRRLCGGTSPGPCGGPCRPLGPPRASIGALYLCAEVCGTYIYIYIYIYAKSTHNIRLCAKLCGAYIYIYIYIYICENGLLHVRTQTLTVYRFWHVAIYYIICVCFFCFIAWPHSHIRISEGEEGLGGYMRARGREIGGARYIVHRAQESNAQESNASAWEERGGGCTTIAPLQSHGKPSYNIIY